MFFLRKGLVKIHLTKGIFALSMLVFLPQCELFKSSPSEQESAPSDAQPISGSVLSGEVLLTIDGTPRVTVDRFENYVATVLEAQPQLKQLIALMPDAELELFKNMANEELLQAWVSKNKIDQSESYKKELQMIQDFGKRQLAIKYFQEKHPMQVSEAEVRKYYDENKNSIPELMVSRGGITANVIEFSKPENAQEFYAKVKDAKADFVQAARDAKLPMKEIKEISEMSFDVEGPVREKVVTIKKFPAVELITGKDKTWVVKVIGKQEPQYVPFEQIQERLAAFLQQQKMAEMFIKEIEKLKGEFTVVENKDYFDRKKKRKEEEMNKLMEKEKGQQQAQNEHQKPASDQPMIIKGA